MLTNILTKRLGISTLFDEGIGTVIKSYIDKREFWINENIFEGIILDNVIIMMIIITAIHGCHPSDASVYIGLITQDY